MTIHPFYSALVHVKLSFVYMDLYLKQKQVFKVYMQVSQNMPTHIPPNHAYFWVDFQWKKTLQRAWGSTVWLQAIPHAHALRLGSLNHSTVGPQVR